MVAWPASAQFKAEPATDPDLTYELDGYSVHAPPGAGWFLMYQDKQSVAFGKRKMSPSHAVTATATSKWINKKLRTLAEVISYVKKGNALSINPRRQTILNNDVVTDEEAPAPLCAGYRLKTRDEQTPGIEGTLFTLSYGIVCIHPRISQLLIDVGYSERGRETELNSELVQNEGVAFVNGVQFTAPPKENQ